MVKRVMSLIAVAAIIFSASAQNARVDAMGGCDIMDDIIGVIGHPADMNDYPDQIQGTAYSATSFGAVIGIKSIGDVVRLGLMANQGSVLRGDFYTSAKTTIDNNILGIANTAYLPTAFPVYPHLLLGINLDAVTIGLDMFVKATRYKNNIDTDGNIVDTTATISNIGGKLGANVGIGNITISPLFGIGIPKASAVYEDDAASVENTVETSSSIFLTAGSEIGIDVGNMTIFAAFFYTLEKYQFHTDINGMATDQNENTGSFMDIYAGLTTEVLGGLFLVSQYNLTIGLDNVIQTNDDELDTNNIVNSLRIGLERPISGVWIFDELIPRGGFSYTINSTVANTTIDATNQETKTNTANSTSQFWVTTGLGLNKGIAAVDVAINFGAWDGVFTGPAVYTGTLTLDFGKTGSSSSTSTTSTPSYTPESSYQSTPSPVTSEESTGEETTGTPETEDESSGSDVDFDF